MKLKKLTLMTLAAMYTAGAGNVAASNHATTNDAKVNLQSVDIMELYRVQQELKSHQVDENFKPLRRSNMTNIQFAPKKTEDKIKIEPNLTGTHTYIIRLHGNSVATYGGGLPGLPATKATTNGKRGKLFTAGKANGALSSAINAYTNHLLNNQNSVIQKAGIQAKQQFTLAANAITAELTQYEAAQIAAMSEVAYVQRSKVYQLHTDIGPEHVGAMGVWDGTKTSDGGAYQGEGMVVGIIDTGVNTDHPSFAATDADGYTHTNPLGSGNYLGDCALEEFANRCNDKLIGVYTHKDVTAEFVDEWGNPLAPKFGEDFQGHGSHVAGTVAGNVLYDVDVVGSELGGGTGHPVGVKMPRISGVAPRANIISYQVCMVSGGCSGDAMLFAIEQAIKDGVDVINMSIGGAESFPWDDAFEMAFLSAREAGVAVALSAGNSGEAFGTDSLYTVDHTSPWVLNVAATTHARSIKIADKALDNFSGGDAALMPSRLDGAGISDAFTGQFVLAADYGDARCNSPFPAGTFSSDHIVVCERGDIARVEKAVNAAAGGAGAFVLYNTWDEGDAIVNDTYAIPGIHITATQWYGNWQTMGLQPWLASGTGHQGTVTASNVTREINPDDADWLANFSSRGPSITVDEIFSPGIAAPGVDIFAPWNDENPLNPQADTRNYNAISGTSMASPHIAGIMALVRQANPDWTASEVQSALQMTADNQAIKTTHPLDGKVEVAGPYRAGHGLANAERAINAGLIMDESADNFRRANPNNGGQVRELNLPQLINKDCGLSCSWIRTVTATKDGTWNVNTNFSDRSPLFWDFTLDPTAKVTVTPSTFTLKAGESIDLTVTSFFKESDMAWYEGTVQTTAGHIELVAEDANIPSSHWPFLATYTGKTLPSTINITAHDDQSHHVIADVPFGAPASSLSGVVYQAVEAQAKMIELPRRQFTDIIIDDEFYWNLDLPHIHTTEVTVPENTAVFRAELLGRVSSEQDSPYNQYLDTSIYIFRDYNQDGRLHQSEAICGSMNGQTTKGEFCALENPDAGDYTILVMNAYPMPPYDNIDTIEMAHVIIPKQESTDITLQFDDSAERNSDLTIDWNMPMEQGKRYYSAAAITAGDNAEGSLALVPLQITRGVDSVSIDSSQDAARVGDIINVDVVIQPNLSGSDRNVELTAMLSDGLRLVPDSIKEMEGLTITDSGFSLLTSQINTADMATNYKITTSLEDAMCRTPLDIDYPDGEPVNGGYLNLSRFGMDVSWGSFYEVNEWGWGNWVHDIEIPVAAGETTVFDNADYFTTDKLILSSKGWLQLDYLQYNPWDFVPMSMYLELPNTEYSTPPDFIIAPFWGGKDAVGDFFGNQKWNLAMYEPNWQLSESKGVTLAYADDYTIIEWNKAGTHDQSWDENWNESITPRGDSYDFQVFLKANTDHKPGQYELIMAYDNIDFAGEPGEGSIGVRGYHGPRGTYGPLRGHTGVSYAFNDLTDKLQDDLIVCYDITGPSESMIVVSMQAEVTDSALGIDQSVTLTGEVEGISNANQTQTITVASNIVMAEIADHVMEENTTLTGISVSYADNDGGLSGNTITVTGDNISAVVHGHTSGSTFDITPDADFHGETMVTVTVADNIYSNDAARTTFMLTVNSDGVEPAPESPETPESPAPESDSGGQLGFVGLILLWLAVGMRRKHS
ncbi:S8 family serine peptidase [Shewanella sp. WXL01]|uniref:S8 family serine peptidase n=1 Tax=Shewanella sp. WXL01 TaxID=2709721 RepID=UPI00143865F1|nr:S8 family serine peptidase [Shewanella sp. WXL01]NKF50797.1 S8 family serine peptidase [Shewanella sp. WXL01]